MIVASFAVCSLHSGRNKKGSRSHSSTRPATWSKIWLLALNVQLVELLAESSCRRLVHCFIQIDVSFSLNRKIFFWAVFIPWNVSFLGLIVASLILKSLLNYSLKSLKRLLWSTAFESFTKFAIKRTGFPFIFPKEELLKIWRLNDSTAKHDTIKLTLQFCIEILSTVHSLLKFPKISRLHFIFF